MFWALVGVLLVSAPAYSEQGIADALLECVGYLLLCTCAAGRMWVAAYISGRKNTQLVTDGPYALCRNPLYFFSAIGFIGAGFAYESFILVPVFIGIYLLTHVPSIRVEERGLRLAFPDEYPAYAAHTPRFLPLGKPDRGNGHIELDSKVFTKAIMDASAILLVFPVLQGLEWLHTAGWLPVLFRLY